MPVHIDDVRMWQAQDARLESKANVRPDAVTGEDSDNTLLTSLESQETFEYTGIATGMRLSTVSGYSSDPLTALAEWVAKAETLVNGAQGTGYTLEDTNRDRSENVTLESIGWQRNEGEKYEVKWDVAIDWANGIMPDRSTAPTPVDPWEGPSVIDGVDVENVQSVRESKQQQIEQYLIAFADPGENEAMADGGAIRKIIIRGDVEGTNVNRNNFDNHFLNLTGQDELVTYEAAFPGRELDVMVSNYESTREAGITQMNEYIIELVEGVA